MASRRSDGTLDTSFSNDGVAVAVVTSGTDRIQAVALQRVSGEDRILAVGVAPLKAGGNPTWGAAVVRFKADGQLDPAFGSGGRVQFGWPTKGDSYANAVAVQCDGKIVVAGAYDVDMAVARLLPNGALDMSFDGDGKVTVSLGRQNANANPGAWGVALQSFGGQLPSGCPVEQRVIVAGNRGPVKPSGNYDIAVARLRANGALDSTFNGAGLQFVDIAGAGEMVGGAAVDASNRIVLAGHTRTGTTDATIDAAVVRLTENGEFDVSFDLDGRVTTDVRQWYDEVDAVAIDSQGRVVIGGVSRTSDFTQRSQFVLRYDTAGQRDYAFGEIFLGPGANRAEVAIAPSDRIVVTSTFDNAGERDVAVMAIHP